MCHDMVNYTVSIEIENFINFKTNQTFEDGEALYKFR